MKDDNSGSQPTELRVDLRLSHMQVVLNQHLSMNGATGVLLLEQEKGG